MDGGSKRNAIPREACGHGRGRAGPRSTRCATALEREAARVLTQLKGIDDRMQLTIEPRRSRCGAQSQAEALHDRPTREASLRLSGC